MKRTSAQVVLVLFLVALPVSAAPQRGDDSPFASLTKIVAKMKKIIAPLDEPSFPKP
jgi:hypothetical protein